MNYTQFYKEVRGYASNYASRLFRDESARIEAVDKAMDLVVDTLLLGEVTLSLAKSITHSSLVDTFRATSTNKTKNLKVRLNQIPGTKEREIMTLYSGGTTQTEIWKSFGYKDHSYVARIIRKWTV